MNYADIVNFDTGNAKGISTTLFVSGCDMTPKCKNCHNQQAWDYCYGKEFTEEKEKEIIQSLKNPHVKYFVLTGGQPTADKNKEICLRLLSKIKEEVPEIKVILYTGKKVDEIDTRFFRYCRYIIDGEYRPELNTTILDLRGSYNQRCWQVLCIPSEKYYVLYNLTDRYFKETEDNSRIGELVYIEKEKRE